ncbi:hypothetical protein MY1884_007566 [Beauveria asiatica]
MRSTTLTIARTKLPVVDALPESVGRFSKRIDQALPGKHTKKTYDQLTRKEAAERSDKTNWQPDMRAN